MFFGDWKVELVNLVKTPTQSIKTKNKILKNIQKSGVLTNLTNSYFNSLAMCNRLFE